MSRLIRAFALIVCVVAVTGTTPAAPVPVPSVPGDEQERLLARCKKFAEQGKIDLYVAATAGLKIKVDDPRQWEPAVDFGRKLMDKAEMKGDGRPKLTPSSYKDFATYVMRVAPDFRRMDEAYLRPDPSLAVPPRVSYRDAVQAPGVVDPGGMCDCLILSRDGVQVGRGIQQSVVFANGDVKAENIIQGTVIVCDGNVSVAKQHIGTSLIVARGDITSNRGISNIVLMAGGKVEFENKNTMKGAHLIVEGKPNTLGVVFFELSTVGLEVKVADKVVQASAVAAGKPCNKAGLKVGDTILEVNGKKPDSAESLRRLLRDALAIGDATMKVKRGDKTEIIRVSLPE